MKSGFFPSTSTKRKCSFFPPPPVGMSPTPARLRDRKQHVSQPSLWYGTSGAVSPHHKNLNSIQRKATVMCLLLCLHDCYTFRHPCHIHTYAQLHIHERITMVMCDYKVKLKTEQEWIFLCPYTCWCTLHRVNENALPEALTCDGDVSHKFALCMCRTPNYSSRWRRPASFEKSSRAWILCLGPNSSPSWGLWKIDHDA